ncbi:MAG: aminoacetone oxidase family FAD-binding enzyme [Bacilli bacterium]|nr:aminoacetone oxidase family FAD-binding enzyme [Bacilli bacterium]
MSKVIIVGGGASGLMCALNSKNNHNEVIILERNSTPGKKILASGNGRCNFYNDDQDIKRYHSESSKINFLFEESNRVLDVFNSLGVKYLVKNGYYYPYSNKSETINNTLINECAKKGIEIKCDYEVTSIRKDNNKFIINDELEGDILVLSTGSMSGVNYEKFYGYELLDSFNLNIIRPLPSLTKLVCEGSFFNKWNGIRTKAIVSSFNNDELIKEESGEILLTDYGISGICVFNISRDIVKLLDDGKNASVKINFLEDYSIEEVFNSDLTIKETLDRVLDDKLVDVILNKYHIPGNKKYDDLNNEEKNNIRHGLYAFELNVIDYKDFKSSQVTQGGLSLDELNDNFEVNSVPNLFVIGELLDIDGDCGGYNLTSAFLTALKASDKIKEL